MDLEGIMLSKTSDRERQIPYDFIYIWNLKRKINEHMTQKQAHRHREQTGGCQQGGDLGGWVKKTAILSKYTASHTIS